MFKHNPSLAEKLAVEKKAQGVFPPVSNIKTPAASGSSMPGAVTNNGVILSVISEQSAQLGERWKTCG